MSSKVYQIIEPDWVEKIKNSKFKTKDDSLFYHYIISDFCNFLLKFIPSYIA